MSMPSSMPRRKGKPNVDSAEAESRAESHVVKVVQQQAPQRAPDPDSLTRDQRGEHTQHRERKRGTSKGDHERQSKPAQSAAKRQT